MEYRPGDQIVVDAHVVGRARRHGTVLSVPGPSRLRVRWEDGRESVYVPGSDCRVEAGEEPAAAVLGCQIDVTVTEDEDHCEAVALLMTGRGAIRAVGVSRRHPDDRPVPVIGEELAIARALQGLADQLVELADDAIANRTEIPGHLVR